MSKTKSRSGMLVLLCMTMIHAQGYKMFGEGNSLQQVQPVFEDVAHDAGYPDHDCHIVGAAGTPVDWCWENLTSRFYSEMPPRAPHDIIEVQPFKTRSDPEDEADAIVQIYSLALEHSPSAKLLVYYTWVNTPRTYASLEDWELAMQQYIDSTLVPMVDIVDQFFTDKPVYVVPVAHAILALSDSIKAGKLPRFSSIDDIFHDGIHMNANGNYFNACVHYAAIYEQNPAGLAHYYIVKPAIYTDTTDLTAEEAAVFQRTAWDVVRNHPRTLVSGIPRHRTDTEPPSKPADLRLVSATAEEFELAWTASTDNGTVGEYFVYAYPATNSFAYLDSFYVTYRWVATETTVTSWVTSSTSPPIQPGVTYKTFVRARDGEFSLSPPSDTLTIEVPAPVQGNAMKFDFGGGDSPVKDGYTQVLPKQLYRPDRGHGFTGSFVYSSSSDNASNSDAFSRDRIDSRYGLPEFVVDLPNGEYTVTVYFGRGDNVWVEAEDMITDTMASVSTGSSVPKTFTVTVADGQLNLRIETERGLVGACGVEIVAGATGNALRSPRALANAEMDVVLHRDRGHLTVAAPGMNIARLDIVDLRGALLHSRTSLRHGDAVSLKTLHAGVYMARLHCGNSVIERRFVLP